MNTSVESYFSASQTAALEAISTDQLAALVSPIVLDLDGDGIETLARAAGVNFDIAAEGQTRQTGWVTGGDGLLARDLDGNGQIDSGAELFGNATQLASGQAAANGFQALAELDSNADGRIDNQDQAFNSLQVWVDGDADGVSDVGELRGLLDAGVVAINLDFSQGTDMQNGNLLGQLGTFVTSEGTEQAAVDVWFATDPSAVPAVGDVLVAAPADVLGTSSDGQASAPASSASVATEEASVTGSIPTTGVSVLDEEWLRNHPPLV
jgi:trimeric autotransporter adhesin